MIHKEEDETAVLSRRGVRGEGNLSRCKSQTCTFRCLLTSSDQLLTSTPSGAHLPPEEKRKSILKRQKLNVPWINVPSSSLYSSDHFFFSSFNDVAQRTASLFIYLSTFFFFFASLQLGRVFRGVYTGDLFPLILHVLR